MAERDPTSSVSRRRAGILWLEGCGFSAFSRATRLLPSHGLREVQCSTWKKPVSAADARIRLAHLVLCGGNVAPPNSCSDGHFGSTLIQQLASIPCCLGKCARAPYNVDATSENGASFIARFQLNLILVQLKMTEQGLFTLAPRRLLAYYHSWQLVAFFGRVARVAWSPLPCSL